MLGRSLEWRVYTFSVLDDLILFYPIYAVLFSETGLSGGEISSLFAIWSVVAFTAELPSGAWADVMPRPMLLAAGQIARAIAFGLWTIAPSYPAFAVGFVLWGLKSATTSGTFESLVYDGLAAEGRAEFYVRLRGRAESLAVSGNIAATALAGVAFAAGGYVLVGIASSIVCVAVALVALGWPEPRRRMPADLDKSARYWAVLRAGLSEAIAHRALRNMIVLSAVAQGITAFDEYLPLLATAGGVATGIVPLVVLPSLLAMVAGGLAAGWLPAVSGRVVSVLLLVATLLHMLGAASSTAAGAVVAGLVLGVLQFARIQVDAWLQHAIVGPARATVTSLASLCAELVAIGVYATWALGSTALPTPLLYASLGVLVLAFALFAALWGPRSRRDLEPGASALVGPGSDKTDGPGPA